MKNYKYTFYRLGLGGINNITSKFAVKKRPNRSFFTYR